MRQVKLWYQPLAPISSIPKVLNSMLDEGMDVLLLAAYCTGTVGRIYFPLIKRATQMKIPVFSIRQAMVDEWFTEWSTYTQEILPGVYGDEADAIGVGLIPLQKDLLKRDEVILGIRQIASQHTDYNTIVGTTMRRFSSDSFNRRLNGLREERNLEPILYQNI